MYKIFSKNKNDKSIVWDASSNDVLFEFSNGEFMTVNSRIASVARTLGYSVENIQNNAGIPTDCGQKQMQEIEHPRTVVVRRRRAK